MRTHSLLLAPGLFWGLVGVGAAVAGSWAWWEARRRSRSRPLRLAVRTLYALGVLAIAGAAAADGINRYYSYIPSFSALSGNISPVVPTGPSVTPAPTHGTVERVVIPGVASRVPPRNALVYLPPGYGASGRRYPVVYLIHGSPGTFEDWIRGAFADRVMDALIAGGRSQPMIIVTPDANGGFVHDSECIDRARGRLNETYLVRDVVGFVDAHFRTVADRSGRAIGGLSSGAFCATNLGLRHSDEFSVVLSHGGYFSPIVSRLSGDLFRGSLMRKRANDPNQYVGSISIQMPFSFYADVGLDDRWSLAGNRAFVTRLQRRGVVVEYHEWPAQRHNWEAWRHDAGVSLAFAGAHLAGDVPARVRGVQ